MKKILYIFGVAMTLLGCYKSEIYDTPSPEKGTLELTIEWTNLHAGDNQPSKYIVLHNSKEYSYANPSNILTELEPNERDEFLVYNLPNGMRVTDGIATLGEATRALAAPDPKPEHIYYGLGKVDLIKDFVAKLTITTKRGTAPLILKLDYEKNEVENIKSVKVELSGIATKRNLLTDVLSDAAVFTLFPTLSPKAEELVLNYNIFGTVGDKQELKITFTTASGQTKVVTSNIGTQLVEFNSAMKPLTLTGNMHLPTDVEAVGSISDWNEVNNGNIEVN